MDIALRLGPNSVLYGSTGAVPNASFAETEEEADREFSEMLSRWIEFLRRELKYWDGQLEEAA